MHLPTALLAVLALSGTVRGHCFSRLGGKSHFDVDKFGGEWLVVARAVDGPLSLPSDGVVCTRLTFVPRHNDNVTWTDIVVKAKGADGAEMVFNSKAQSSSSDSFMRFVWKLPGQDVWTGVGHLSVLATDYDQFALLHYTKEIFSEDKDVIEKLSVVDVLSRTSTLHTKVLDTLKSVVKSLNFDEADVKDVGTSGCSSAS